MSNKNSFKSIITTHVKDIPSCHEKRINLIIKALRNHVPYKKLGGVKIKRRPELVRFKIGREYRFLFKIINGYLSPYQLITRQQFDRELKRRR